MLILNSVTQKSAKQFDYSFAFVAGMLPGEVHLAIPALVSIYMPGILRGASPDDFKVYNLQNKLSTVRTVTSLFLHCLSIM